MTDVDPFNPGGIGTLGAGDALGGLDAEAMAFVGAGFVSAVWPEEGFTVEGTVTEVTMMDQRDPDTNEAMFFVPGSQRPVPESMVPRQFLASAKRARQMRMVLQGPVIGHTWKTLRYVKTELPDDDGVRAAYLKGNLQKAVADAIRKANAKLEIGAYVRITRGKDLPPVKATYSPRHTYTALWLPAAQNTANAQAFMDAAPAGVADNPWAV